MTRKKNPGPVEPCPSGATPGQSGTVCTGKIGTSRTDQAGMSATQIYSDSRRNRVTLKDSRTSRVSENTRFRDSG